jgi:hypothetical protein
MILENAFTKDNRMLIFVLLRESKTKLRKVGVGKINIYKKYFLAKTYNFQKWIYLDLNLGALNISGPGENLQNSEILSAMTTTGKIFMHCTLLNPPPEDDKIFSHKYEPSVHTSKTGGSIYSIAIKNNIKNLENTKAKIQNNRSEKYRSITEHTNDFLKNVKAGKYAHMWANDVIDEECPEGSNF